MINFTNVVDALHVVGVLHFKICTYIFGQAPQCFVRYVLRNILSASFVRGTSRKKHSPHFFLLPTLPTLTGIYTPPAI